MFYTGEFPGGYDSMLLDYEPSQNRPWKVNYLGPQSRRMARRSFTTCADAVAFAKVQARLNVLDFLLGGHEALEALA